jgi:diacylglycerol kinase family enzyme
MRCLQRIGMPGNNELTAHSRELPVLLNVAAGGVSQLHVAALKRLFAAQHVCAHIESSPPQELEGRLAELLNAGARAVGIAGGDGSISLAADVLAGSETVLIPIPFGSSNHFARRFGLVSIEAAALALQHGAVITIPVGEVNGRCFVNNVSCGFYPRMVRQRDRLRPLLSRWPATVLAAGVITVRRPLIDLAIQMDGTLVRRRTTAAWIGIGRQSLQLPEAGAGPRGGDVLEVLLPRPRRRLALLALAMRLWSRLHRQETPSDMQLETLRAPEFTLQSNRPIDVAIDGETSVLHQQLHFRYRKNALRVLALLAEDQSAA